MENKLSTTNAIERLLTLADDYASIAVKEGLDYAATAHPGTPGGTAARAALEAELRTALAAATAAQQDDEPICWLAPNTEGRDVWPFPYLMLDGGADPFGILRAVDAFPVYRRAAATGAQPDVLEQARRWRKLGTQAMQMIGRNAEQFTKHHREQLDGDFAALLAEPDLLAAATAAQPDPTVMQYLALTDAMHYEAGPQLLSAEEYAAQLYADASKWRAAAVAAQADDLALEREFRELAINYRGAGTIVLTVYEALWGWVKARILPAAATGAQPDSVSLPRNVAQYVLDALEIGRDAAHQVAQEYHGAMAGYRQHEHDRLDRDVEVVKAAHKMLADASGPATDATGAQPEPQDDEPLTMSMFASRADLERAKTERTAKKIDPGSEYHLTLLMAPHSLNFVTGQDRQHLLAWGRAVWAAALDHVKRERGEPIGYVLRAGALEGFSEDHPRGLAILTPYDTEDEARAAGEKCGFNHEVLPVYRLAPASSEPYLAGAYAAMRAGKEAQALTPDAQLEAARFIDALRYRWLRNQAVNFGRDNGEASPWVVLGTRAEDATPCRGEALDTAVDAARASA